MGEKWTAFKNIHWTVLDTETNSFLCQRCWGREKMPDCPILVNDMVAIMEKFSKKHQHCKVGDIPKKKSG